MDQNGKNFIPQYERRSQNGWKGESAQHYQLSQEGTRNASRLSFRDTSIDTCVEDILNDQHFQNLKQVFENRWVKYCYFMVWKKSVYPPLFQDLKNIPFKKKLMKYHWIFGYRRAIYSPVFHNLKQMFKKKKRGVWNAVVLECKMSFSWNFSLKGKGNKCNSWIWKKKGRKKL